MLLAARLTWEQTFLTWDRGPQMVGFSLAHTGGVLALFLFACLALSYLWVFATLILLIWYSIRGRRPRGSHFLQFGLLAGTVGLLLVPYGFWQWVGVRTVGPRGHEASYFASAAGEGDFRLVKTLLAQNVAIDIQEPDGGTALRGAATAGRLDMVKFLVEHGAQLNLQAGILQRSALMNAAEMGRLEIVRYLLVAGADPLLADAKGRRAVDIARGNGHMEIVALIENRTRQ